MKNDWQIKTLGEVCDVIGGGTPSKANANFYKGDIPWATVRDLKDGIIADTEFKITKEAVKQSSTNIIPKDNVIIASRVGLGKVCLLGMDAAINQDLRAIIPKKANELSVNYLYRWLGSVSNLIVEAGSGATVQGVRLPFIKGLEIPVPPLPEQRRIVAILDDVFERTAKAKANAEKNLANAKEVFESYLQQVFANPIGDWKEKSIADVCVEIFAGGDAPNENFSIEKSEKYAIPIYANAVKDRGLYGYTNFAKVTKPSITIAARGSGTGHTELRNEAYLPIVRLIVLIPNTELVTLDFLKYKIDTIDILRSGSAIPQLTVPMIKEYGIPIPSLKEQRTIVSNLDALSSETKKLETIYRQKLSSLEELKKSVLRSAFRGEL